tara:strand:+ start:570 stop:860 length:291 start_codon:yes stop_codon:yes gene_type:complete
MTVPDEHRKALKHAIRLGMLTMQIVQDYEANGGLTSQQVTDILDSISKIYTMIGLNLGLEKEVNILFLEVKEEIKSFHSLPLDIKKMLMDHGEGIA